MRDYPTNKRMMLFSGSSNPALALKVSEYLKMELGQVERKKFKNGEIYVRFNDSVRGADVFVMQTSSDPVNDNIMELLIMIDALKRASAGMINVVMPHYGYARQDKKSEGREPITAKLLADILQTAGMDRLIVVDLHTATIQGFFDVPVDHITAIPIIAKYFREKDIKNAVVVSPDVGGVKRASIFSKQLELPLAILDKRRPEHNVSEVEHIVGDVENKDAIIFDDLIDTGGTLVEAINILLDHGAKKVYAAATHPIFSGQAVEILANSRAEEIIVADTIPINRDYDKTRIKQLSIANLLAKTIKKVYDCKSVSELFKGENLV
ncbi:MAG: ribose-phosphate pyrophosphokinase [Actinobacteria bacterium]|nr:ribose-phosphate pyrophosphokinase [Actinomycetota bacterium]MCL6087586.1 ribose-phosphate pyrophosphokinase [Actinomycetota bacterium]